MSRFGLLGLEFSDLEYTMEDIERGARLGTSTG